MDRRQYTILIPYTEGERALLKRFRVRASVALVLLSMVAAACGGDDDGGGSASGGGGDGGGGGGGSITIALGSEPTTLDPQIREDGGERAVNDNIYETLIARDREGELYPLLAADMPEQVDDTTWEVTLREGIEFHNGSPLDAEAVAGSFNRIIDPDLGSEQSSFVGGITGAEAVDDLTVQFTTEGPDPVFPARLYWIKVVDPAHAEESNFAESPIGTGPYKFVEWRRGQQVVIEANDDYWGDDKPTIERVTYKFVSEPGTRLSGLTAGEFDLITNLLPDDVDRAPKSAHVMGLEHPVFLLNTFEGVTADVNVRRAMNLAVDKDALANDLYGGFARVDDCQILSPSFFGYNGDLDPYDYDPDEAKRLIDEAGAAGQTVSVVSTSGRWLKDRELTEAVAGFWTAAGLRVDVQIFEFDEYLNRLFDSETRAPAIFVTSSNELLDAGRQLGAFYHMDGIGGSNEDAEMAAMIDEAAVETDVDAREDLYHQITKKACDDAYFTFLLNIEDTYGMSERLEWEPRVDAKIIVNEMELS
jgi:peptide/nickel transport system substrate-binding protein